MERFELYRGESAESVLSASVVSIGDVVKQTIAEVQDERDQLTADITG